LHLSIFMFLLGPITLTSGGESIVIVSVYVYITMTVAMYLWYSLMPFSHPLTIYSNPLTWLLVWCRLTRSITCKRAYFDFDFGFVPRPLPHLLLYLILMDGECCWIRPCGSAEPVITFQAVRIQDCCRVVHGCDRSCSLLTRSSTRVVVCCQCSPMSSNQ
jgi:hypothetical protein